MSTIVAKAATRLGCFLLQILNNFDCMNLTEPVTDIAKVDAGDFEVWLAQAIASFQGPVGINVPCGSCRGCCTSSYFIHVRPDDYKTISVVPKTLLVDAPGLEQGYKLVGFKADGSCALLKERECSIYTNRPQTCRDYDCRVFVAAGIDAGGKDKSTINQRIHAWQFSYATSRAKQTHHAIKKAASFIVKNRTAFPGGRAPVMPSDIAVLAIKVHHVFLTSMIGGTATEIAAEIVRESREFEALRRA